MKIAFVTPSYRGDFERCRLLCESTTRFLPPDVQHILIIDRQDVDLFRPIENDVVRIVESESLMPWWIFKVPGISRWRANLTGLPVRGWIYQQLLKIAAISATDADVLQFLDSDVTLIRNLNLADIVRADGKVRLQHTSFEGEQHRLWRSTACRILGIDGAALSGNFVGNFITWRRDNVLKMQQQIGNRGANSWVRILASHVRFSEYMLYGAFVTAVLGIEESGHFVDTTPNIALCWDFDVRTDEGMSRFFESVPADAFGVMIHSKYHIPIERYRHHIEKLWNRGVALA